MKKHVDKSDHLKSRAEGDDADLRSTFLRVLSVYSPCDSPKNCIELLYSLKAVVEKFKADLSVV